jgi:hypothetical protein
MGRWMDEGNESPDRRIYIIMNQTIAIDRSRSIKMRLRSTQSILLFSNPIRQDKTQTRLGDPTGGGREQGGRAGQWVHVKDVQAPGM